MGAKKYDFSGWATKNDLLCSDGRTIRKDAFKHQDGAVVPLVWQHMHDSPSNILGKAILENRPEGVYAYGIFNGTEAGLDAKTIVEHGDIESLSIHANHLKQRGGDVIHGDIKEVSLVLAGANPGAYIDFPMLEHSEDGEEKFEEAVIYTGETLQFYHADPDEDVDDKDEDDKNDSDDPDDNDDADDKDKKNSDDADDDIQDDDPDEDDMKHADDDSDKSVEDVLNTFNADQKKVLYYLLAQAVEKNNSAEHSDSEGGNDEMKHNVFDKNTELTHSNKISEEDMKTLLADAKRLGSLKEAVLQHSEDGVLSHMVIDPDGMDQPTGTSTYGFNDPDFLFPEFRTMSTTPEWLKRDTDWVAKVMSGVHRTPFSRIKSVFANITEDEARAKGYMKTKLKKEEVFSLLKRRTDPQTIYKKQKLDRDDVVDITDFDVVAWIRGEMRMMLDEEIARAILIGDGRLPSDDDKIFEEHIRPIVTDKPLFNIKVDVQQTTDAAETAKNFINEAIRARKFYKGTGTPKLFTTADMHTEMLLLEDGIGHKMYKTDAELATALRVSEIVEVEVMDGVQVDGKNLFGTIVNMADYNVGADKGGAISMFDDFDIDYNQMKYLIETRISGALIKPFSAITLLGVTA